MRPLPWFFGGLLLLLTGELIQAGSATWNLNPTSGDWDTAANWTPATVPEMVSDTATFGVSNTTSILNILAGDIDGIVFSPGASSFTITNNSGFNFHGVGIINNSGARQTLVSNGPAIQFFGATTAGDAEIFNLDGLVAFFWETATAGKSTITNVISMFSFNATNFQDTSTAGEATVIANAAPHFGGLGTSINFGPTTSGGTARVKMW